MALDPRARDRALAARRSLGDYARMARLVGALTCHHNQAYRRLAQSLDEVGSLILVLIGEALGRIGFGGGRFLLQAPASELQARRDAVLLALRNLTGSTQEAYGSKDWPYGLHGLREVLRLLDESGHADLRAMLEENALGRLMDDLLDRASTVSAYALRGLGATAAVAVQRLNRLVQIIDDRVVPPSPPVVAFLEAVRLFTDGFQGTAAATGSCSSPVRRWSSTVSTGSVARTRRRVACTTSWSSAGGSPSCSTAISPATVAGSPRSAKCFLTNSCTTRTVPSICMRSAPIPRAMASPNGAPLPTAFSSPRFWSGRAIATSLHQRRLSAGAGRSPADPDRN